MDKVQVQSEVVRLTQAIADTLDTIYYIKQDLFTWELLREKQLFELTPDTGWEGKNVDQRKRTEILTLQEDLIYIGFNYMYQNRKRKLEYQQMYLETLKTFRRGTESLIQLEHLGE